MVSQCATLMVLCESSHRVRAQTSRTRDLLLRAEPASEEAARELGRLGAAVARDLDTIGDLGMCRLERSTNLAVVSTVITYAIVLLQFYVG